MFEIASATTEELAAACGPTGDIMAEMIKEKSKETDDYIEVDASGLSCPGPLNAMIKGLEELPENKALKIYATDPGFKASVEAYARLNEAVKLLSLGKKEGKLVATLKKDVSLTKELKAPILIQKQARQDLRGPNAPPLSNISAEELYERIGSDEPPAILIDVRSPQEYNSPEGYIKGTKLMPLGELMNNIESLNEYKDKEVVMICHSGARSMMASQLLVQSGFKDVRNLTGGMMMWHRKGYPIEGKAEYY